MCEAFDLIMAKHYKEGYIEGYQEEYRQGYKEVTGKDLTPEQELVCFKDLEKKAEKAAEKYCRKEELMFRSNSISESLTKQTWKIQSLPYFFISMICCIHFLLFS